MNRLSEFLQGLDHQPWMRWALCAQIGGDAFFPDKGQRDKARDAKAICNRCEVRDQCSEYALLHDERFGIWGATTANQRRIARNPKPHPLEPV